MPADCVRNDGRVGTTRDVTVSVRAVELENVADGGDGRRRGRRDQQELPDVKTSRSLGKLKTELM